MDNSWRAAFQAKPRDAGADNPATARDVELLNSTGETTMGIEIGSTPSLKVNATDKASSTPEPIMFRNVYVSYGVIDGYKNQKPQSIRQLMGELLQGKPDDIVATSEQVTLKLNPHIKSIDQVMKPGQIKVVAKTGDSVSRNWGYHTARRTPEKMEIDVDLARFGIGRALTYMQQDRNYYADRAFILTQLPTEQFGGLLKKEFTNRHDTFAPITDEQVAALMAEHARLKAVFSGVQPTAATRTPEREEESRKFISTIDNIQWGRTYKNS